jgi:uncharacterized DUF497 family protein
LIQFEWDEEKNRTNKLKHGVWFEEAQQVFDDVAALRYFDAEHSEYKDRFILLGMSSINRTLVVVYCEQETPLAIRIISARKATKNEVKAYEKGI